MTDTPSPRRSRGLILVAILCLLIAGTVVSLLPRGLERTVIALSRLDVGTTTVQREDELKVTIFGAEHPSTPGESLVLLDLGAVRVALEGHSYDAVFGGSIPSPSQGARSAKNADVNGVVYLTQSGTTESAECAFYEVPFELRGDTLSIAGVTCSLSEPRLILLAPDGTLLHERRFLRPIATEVSRP